MGISAGCDMMLCLCMSKKTFSVFCLSGYFISSQGFNLYCGPRNGSVSAHMAMPVMLFIRSHPYLERMQTQYVPACVIIFSVVASMASMASNGCPASGSPWFFPRSARCPFIRSHHMKDTNLKEQPSGRSLLDQVQWLIPDHRNWG